MSTRENLSYQGELPAVSYRRNDSPDATAKVGGDAVSVSVSAESAARYPPGRRRGIRLGIHGIGGVPMTLDDVGGELALWNAVLALLLDDARAHLAGKADPSGIYRAACLDLLNAGPMTRHVARFCLLDPEHVRAQFRRYAAGFAVAGGSHEGVSLPVRHETGRRRKG